MKRSALALRGEPLCRRGYTVLLHRLLRGVLVKIIDVARSFRCAGLGGDWRRVERVKVDERLSKFCGSSHGALACGSKLYERKMSDLPSFRAYTAKKHTKIL